YPNEKTSKNQQSETSDTLNNPHHPSWLADKSPKEIGQMILDNKIQPTDNDVTSRVMDSLLSKNADERKFYFKVFIKILENADGALAEMAGTLAIKYVENYTSEFLDLSAGISKENFDSWASFVGWEILLSSNDDPVKDGELFTEKLLSDCPELIEKDRQRLKSFNDIIMKSIRENQE
ncbi:MAG: hypothetical protein MUC30_04155, partial [Bacteroidales bacterium]|nr:hypothetical protein [Bacteroidales bacterium]